MRLKWVSQSGPLCEKCTKRSRFYRLLSLLTQKNSFFQKMHNSASSHTINYKPFFTKRSVIYEYNSIIHIKFIKKPQIRNLSIVCRRVLCYNPHVDHVLQQQSTARQYYALGGKGQRPVAYTDETALDSNVPPSFGSEKIVRRFYYEQ